jgi:hypothetical protein
MFVHLFGVFAISMSTGVLPGLGICICTVRNTLQESQVSLLHVLRRPKPSGAMLLAICGLTAHPNEAARLLWGRLHHQYMHVLVRQT